MDEPQTRAQLATMEVIGKLMIGLAEAGVLPPAFLAQAAQTAAERLEPTADGLYLDVLAEQWRNTARYVRGT
jgi:hypothetical protein